MSKERSEAVTVAYVHGLNCTMSWHQSIVEMLAHDMANEGHIMRGGWVAIHSGTDGLVESRNMAVKTFLAEKQADWLFWTDTDMGFKDDTLDRLLAVADPVDHPMVGALCYSQRETEPDGMGGYVTALTPTIFDWTHEKEQYGWQVRWRFPENEPVRCSATGSACVLIHRSVFEKVERAHGPVWYNRVPNTTTGQLIGEDLSFCLRAGALNIPIYVHTGVEASHAKLDWFGNRQYNNQLQNEAIRRLEGEPTAVIVPVMRRPKNAEPFMKSLKASSEQAHAYAIANVNDQPTIDAWEKAGAKVITTTFTTFAEKVNFGYYSSDEPWLLLVGDDVHFHPGWLKAAQSAGSAGASVIGTNDLVNPRVRKGQHTCHPLIRRSYIKEQGASWDGPGLVAHEGYGHWFVDDEIVTAAKQRGVWAMALDSVVEHLHPLFGKGKKDAVYELGISKAAADKRHFEERLEKYAPEFDAIVVVPFTQGRLKPQTQAAVKESGLHSQFYRLADSDSAYHNLIESAWDEGKTFITVEQDIVPHEGALRELLDCPEPWCAFEYEYPPFGLYAGMGCAKFSSTLIAKFPDAMTETGKWDDDTPGARHIPSSLPHPPKHWCRVDGWLKQYLEDGGARQHVHGVVEHLSSGRPAHDCLVGQSAAAR